MLQIVTKLFFGNMFPNGKFTDNALQAVNSLIKRGNVSRELNRVALDCNALRELISSVGVGASNM